MQIFYNIKAVELAMENGIIEALQDNKSLLEDLMKSFRVTEQSGLIRITDFILKGSFSASDKDEIVVTEILRQREKDAIELVMAKNEIGPKPLHRFTVPDVFNTIRCWVLNDVDHIKRTKLFMTIASKQGWSGKKLIKFDNNLGVILEKEILPFMTQSSFNKIFNYLQKMIFEDTEHLSTKSAPEIAEIIADFSLNALCDSIMNNDINGQKVIDFRNKNNDTSWIENCTGWNNNEIKQFVAVLFQNVNFSFFMFLYAMYV